jgi:hypothetical protein
MHGVAAATHVSNVSAVRGSCLCLKPTGRLRLSQAFLATRAHLLVLMQQQRQRQGVGLQSSSCLKAAAMQAGGVLFQRSCVIHGKQALLPVFLG